MLRFLPLKKFDIDSFEKIYNDLLIQFPKEELKSKEHFQNLLQSPDYKFSLIYSDKNQVGYITYIKTDYIWVDYYALYKDFQSSGHGTKILEKLFEENNNLKGCFFEVEPIDFQKINTTKRQSFYNRLGCMKLDFLYLFPKENLSLELFYKPISQEIPSKNEILEQIEKIFDIAHFDIQTRNKTLMTIKKLNEL